MFWLASWSMSWPPWPPMPTPAMLIFSLGAASPEPATTWRGTTVKAATPAAAVPMNPRRVIFCCFTALLLIQ